MINDIEFFNLLTESKINYLSLEKKIQLNKKYSELMKKSRELAKPSQCFLCGKKCTSFCNSHTIPQFILKNISNTGKYLNINSLLKLPMFKQSIGLNEANIFRLICHDCDKKYFSTYENPSEYKNTPSQKILGEIALKNSLRFIWKRRVETASYTQIKQLSDPETLGSLQAQKTLEVNNLDLKEFIESSKLAIKTIDGKTNGYYLLDYFTLDYITQIAYQGEIAMVSGFDDDLINDIYSKDARYKIQSLHICIFPIDNKTHVFLFIEDGDRRYSKFYKKYKKLLLPEKLNILNYIIILYSEEWLLTTSVDEEILKNEQIKEIVSITTNTNPFVSLFYNQEKEFKNKALEKAVKTFSLKNIPNIPNFLTKH